MKEEPQPPPSDMQKAFEEAKKFAFPAMIATVCLALINKKPRHGYEIMKQGNKLIKKHLGSQFEVDMEFFTSSNTYPVLHDLEEQGFLDAHWEKGKKYYSLTPQGEKNFQVRKKILKKGIKVKIQLCKELFDEEVI